VQKRQKRLTAPTLARLSRWNAWQRVHQLGFDAHRLDADVAVADNNTPKGGAPPGFEETPLPEIDRCTETHFFGGREPTHVSEANDWSLGRGDRAMPRRYGQRLTRPQSGLNSAMTMAAGTARTAGHAWPVSVHVGRDGSPTDFLPKPTRRTRPTRRCDGRRPSRVRTYRHTLSATPEVLCSRRCHRSS
jgi:hypothetical protein